MKNKMNVKIKRLGKEEFKVVIKTEKGSGSLFLKRCLKCNEVFVTNNEFELFCKQCDAKLMSEAKELFKGFINDWESIINKLNKCDNTSNKKSSKTPDNTKSKEPKDIKVYTKKQKRYYSAFAYCQENKPQIIVPKYDEKFNVLKKNRAFCLNHDVGLKIMEFIARGKTLKEIANIFEIKETSTFTYFNDLRNAGLIVNTSQGWIINPAIKYELL